MEPNGRKCILYRQTKIYLGFVIVLIIIFIGIFVVLPASSSTAGFLGFVDAIVFVFATVIWASLGGNDPNGPEGHNSR
ncbi:MAG: hypothetical protein UW64_C0017G0003 [Microgenomates group bacterium GW2011_GWC1_44_37]|uniref:Uncharacterized protein n=1 Tax=Candidatus Collierbacteria bacterium GW2011_GWB2_44_22 TaxID=1618387 RepID=A0A0G1HYK1_9BACT|nr:MAG: hypothetical protein UW31_C0010G0075 [Candidatus Collierbacteria bacterium GW2011_GWA2_44_13]KKT51638.1 MAG: hypothetical protein UW44_C0009G0002 [Candidatus Collierbacteria bacterium GW2011_GWB2_44_22]KKT62566.1 MAG: hypothetical protein UW56_C0005G0002 [Candidatus Collierbacteria bacterium GW2011_GWD1_44_27]KKT64550.1 MAG: hypothetical protein UW58_C0040G0002 [Candidatus Collierbacteria bacterium GW2011_GWC2_44_30]KKT68493.1 MAG: hypothetical protein UW64_C0017G0003 [Microgenomates gr